MKHKLTSFHLLSIVLIQIILIDLVLALFLIGYLNKGKAAEYAVAEGETVSVQESMKAEIPQQAQEKTAETEGGKKYNNYTLSPIANRSEYDGLKALVVKISPGIGHMRDLKLSDVYYNGVLIGGEFTATAYDLSYESCGKYPDHPEYGITFSGKKAVKGRTIAVDPKVIPLGSKVFIEFPEPYVHMDGWYYAEDTGSKVKGRIVDVFFGERALGEAKKFGRRKVNLRIMR